MRLLHTRPGATRAGVAAVAVGALALALTGANSAAAAETRVKVPNSQPLLSGMTAKGAASTSQKVEVKLYLAPSDGAGLLAKAQAVSTPGAATYRKYLTPAQFHAAYDPSAANLATVRAFLTGNGLSVTSGPDNDLYMSATGTVADVQKAFGTSLKTYGYKGRTVRAAATDPTVPDSLKGIVVGVSGLASIGRVMTTGAANQAPPPDAFVNAPPCSTYYGQKVASALPSAYGSKQPYVTCGYTPSQLQGAYGLKSSIAKGITGKGTTVAILDAYAAPTILSDANTYATTHGQPAFKSGQFTQTLPSAFSYGFDDTVNGNLCDEQGWYGEETLDVEAVHAVAPGAKVSYVASASCDDDDFLDALNTIVDGHLADMITNSWGDLGEGADDLPLVIAYQRVFLQAAVEGIGVYFSSGDSGDESINTDDGNPVVDAPANSPFVTAVGGTSLAVGASDQRMWETGWSTTTSTLTNGAWTPTPPGTYLYGAGGGTSQLFPEPWYQKGVVPSSLATRYQRSPHRVVPDVSAVGDPNTGMLVGETQTFPDGTVKYSEYRIGGTSLASPLFAGMMALADQSAGYAHGFANPALYRAYGSKAFYDPAPVSDRGVVRVNYTNSIDASEGTSTVLRSIDETADSILKTRYGYDDITGVGSVNGPGFLRTLG